MEIEERPAYYAVIPASVRYDEKLIPAAKLLYGEITALSNKNGYCWASNEYFSKLYHVSKRTISLWITSLKENGYIESSVIYKENSCQVDKRLLKIISTPMEEKFNTPHEEIFYTPHEEKFQENNTSINNTSINKNIGVFFESIWKEYPNKRGKGSISDKKKRELYALGYDTIKKCIDRYLKENKNPTYYKHGSTFFNTGYIDYLDENYIIEKQPEPQKKEIKSRFNSLTESEIKFYVGKGAFDVSDESVDYSCLTEEERVYLTDKGVL